MKIDLKDVTFNIPFKKDSEERLENAVTIVKYIQKYFDTNIIVSEQDDTKKFPDMDGVKHIFLQTSNNILLRTTMLNNMCKLSSTPFVANYDTDVLFKETQYVTAVDMLRKTDKAGVFPYGGRFLNYINNERRKIIDTLSLDGMEEGNGHLIHPSSVGGAIIWNKQKFIKGGMENENFKSWGFEDNERMSRFIKLGYAIGRTDGILYHLSHPVSLNSSNTKHIAYSNNHFELAKVNNMTKEKLEEYINTWSWNK